MSANADASKMNARDRAILMRQLYGEADQLTGLLCNIARRLKQMREASGLQQRELAAKLGTSQQQVYALENARSIKTDTRFRSIFNYADELGYDTQVIFIKREPEVL